MLFKGETTMVLNRCIVCGRKLLTGVIGPICKKKFKPDKDQILLP